MKVVGRIVQIIGYIAAIFASLYFGVVPALNRVWTWRFGIALVIGIVVAGLLIALGGWLRNKAKEGAKQKSDNK